MKIIKSFLLVTVGLCATALLHAQALKTEGPKQAEVKTEVLKQTEIKAPPMAVKDNKPSPAPEFKPQNGVVPKEAPAAASAAPSPFKKDEIKKQIEEPKTEIKTIDANAATNKLSAENLKTLNGKAERPKQIAPVAAVDAQGAKPQIITVPAPVVIKEQ